MDSRELADTLAREVQILKAAVDEANETLGKKLGVMYVNQLSSVYAYIDSLTHRIDELRVSGYMEDPSSGFEHWNTRFHDNPPLTDEQNERPWWKY
jgi:hypothetical protein